MSNENFKEFTNAYSLSKTLRFELRPVNADGEYLLGKDYYNPQKFSPSSLLNGDGELNLKKILEGTLNEDKLRAYIHYPIAKVVADSIHKQFINNSLTKIIENQIPGLNLDLSKAFDVFKKINCNSIEQNIGDQNESLNRKDLKKVRSERLKEWLKEKARIRKEIIKCFEDDDFKKLTTSKLFSELVKSEKYELSFQNSLEDVRFLLQEMKLDPFYDDLLNQTFARIELDIDANFTENHLRQIMSEFTGWTVYFKDYHETRKNFYKHEKSTSIAFRLVDDNLTKFFKNTMAYEVIKKSECLNTTQDELLPSELKDLGLDGCFQPDSYVRFITQPGIDLYNEIIGGLGTRKGINQLVKECNDKSNKVRQEGDKSKKTKLNKMFQLDKQILSDKDDTHRLPEFLQDKDLFKEIRDFREKIPKPISKIKELVKSIKTLDLDRIYVINTGSNLSSLSSELFDGDYNLISKALEHYALNTEYPSIDGKQDTKKLREQRGDFLEEEAFSINKLNQIIDSYINSYEDSVKEKFLSKYSKVENYFFDFERIDKLIGEKEKELNDSKILDLEKLSLDRQVPSDENKNGGEGYRQIQTIKAYIESYLEITRFLKLLYPFSGKKEIILENTDNDFYADFNQLYTQLDKSIHLLHTRARNYLTKKSYQKDKFKISFQKPTFLDGWSTSKENDYLAVLFLKENQLKNFDYFLGVLHRDDSRFSGICPEIGNGQAETYLKVEYVTAGRIRGNIPRIFFNPVIKELTTLIENINQRNKIKKDDLKLLESYLPKDIFFNSLLEKAKSEYQSKGKWHEGFDPILKIIQEEKVKNEKLRANLKNTEINKNELCDLITVIKERIQHPDSSWSKKGFKFRADPSEYETYDQFITDLEQSDYCLKLVPVPKSDIKRFSLFKIHTKDFTQYQEKKQINAAENLHTTYWRKVFEPWLIGKPETANIMLNAGAEIFFREASLKKEKSEHSAGEVKCKNRLDESGEPLKRKFEYDLVKDKRFTQDKLFFHVPIKINYRAALDDFILENIDKKLSDKEKFNIKVREYLRKDPSVAKIMGIDRGENNLLYVSIIDSDGKIEYQKSFNVLEYEINKEPIEVDYAKKLYKLAKNRTKARQDWASIENIKELKSGYLSVVIHEIVSLIVKHNCLVVLENLNSGFKRNRLKFEKQVYQKFETALINKLSYLYFKPKARQELGIDAAQPAFQLVPEFKTIKELTGQTGIVLYVNPAHTSKIDPMTGYVNLIDFTYKTKETAQKLLQDFDSFEYIPSLKCFEIKIDYTGIEQVQKKQWGTQSEWIICIQNGVERYQYKGKNNKGYTDFEAVDAYEKLENLFIQNNIISKDSTEKILSKISDNSQLKSEFYEELFRLLKLVFSLRHGDKTNDPSKDIKEADTDFILSPVKGINGKCFDSREILKEFPVDKSGKEKQEQKIRRAIVADLPLDSDANGAYHIAMKGLLILNRIKELEHSSDELEMSISNEDWFRFIQNHHETKWKEKSLSPI